MKDLAIIGAGGFGREVRWVIDRINQASLEPIWNTIGLIDDGLEKGSIVDGLEVLGGCDYLVNYNKEISSVCAIAKPETREKIVNMLSVNPKILFPNIVDPSAIKSDDLVMGKGNVVFPRTILTVNVRLGDFNHINIDCTIGHDSVIKNYNTLYPSVNVSGNVIIKEYNEIGTGAHIIQGITINSQGTLGAGAVVIEDIETPGTYVGVPCKKVR